MIYKEYLLTKKMVLKLTGYTELMQNEPANKASVDVKRKNNTSSCNDPTVCSSTYKFFLKKSS